MREFGKIKMLLDTADIDEDEWDRTRGSCELLGGRLQQIRHGIISIAQFSPLFGLQNERAQRNLNSRNILQRNKPLLHFYFCCPTGVGSAASVGRWRSWRPTSPTSSRRPSPTTTSTTSTSPRSGSRARPSWAPPFPPSPAIPCSTRRRTGTLVRRVTLK